MNLHSQYLNKPVRVVVLIEVVAVHILHQVIVLPVAGIPSDFPVLGTVALIVRDMLKVKSEKKFKVLF